MSWSRTHALALAAGAVGAASLLTAVAGRRASPPGQVRPATEGRPAEPSPLVDVTACAGLDFVHRRDVSGDHRLHGIMSGGGAFLDHDGDGDLDVFLVQGGGRDASDSPATSRLYRNDGGGRFTDVTEESGAAVGGRGMGCAVADVDRDGDLDILVTRDGPDVLLLGDGDGTFTDSTVVAGLGEPGFSTSAAFLDFDRDGWLDLYVARYVRESAVAPRTCLDLAGLPDYCDPTRLPRTTDRLYRNLGDGRFEDVTDQSGIGSREGYGLALSCTDFDGDGWVDIYVANDQSPAFLWRNRGDGTFVDEAFLAGCAVDGNGEAIAGMGTAAEDFDGDGDLDLFVTNIRRRDNLFLRNDKGRFRDVSSRWAEAYPMRRYTGFGVAAFDQDLDGKLELFVANGAVGRAAAPVLPGEPYAEPSQLFRRDGGGPYDDVSGSLGPDVRRPAVSRGVARGDFDGDGDTDLLVLRNGARPQLLRNERQGARHWLVVDPREPGGAAAPPNVRVALEAGGQTWLAEVRPHDGYLTSSDPRPAFGLGEVAVVDELTLTWPDGLRESWRGVAADRVLRLTRGEGAPVEGP